MDIKDISDLNKKWTEEYGKSVEYGDGTFEVHAGHLGSIREWINDNMECAILHFRFDFDVIKNQLEIQDVARFLTFYDGLGEADLQDAYFYYDDGTKMFIRNKEDMFEVLMNVVKNMDNYEIKEYHKFLVDILAFE
ncbi:MAG: hypothetical protein IKG40_01775 [Bacilli bacterium]|nr:hypothetical protein [Bacilli bacterium]